jgi:transcriptional regulator with XRE-family HTH domain
MISTNKYIKTVRKNLGLSQKDFGKHFNKTRDAIANYEIGRVAVPAPFLKEVQRLDRKTKRIQDAFISLKRAGASAL